MHSLTNLKSYLMLPVMLHISKYVGLTFFFFDGSHPDVSRNYQNRVVSVKHNLIYSLITIRVATCFNPTGSSSGLLYEPINVRKLRTFLGSQQCLQG